MSLQPQAMLVYLIAEQTAAEVVDDDAHLAEQAGAVGVRDINMVLGPSKREGFNLRIGVSPGMSVRQQKQSEWNRRSRPQ